MSTAPDRDKSAMAMSWHLRLRDADEDAWVEFAGWLEADPANNRAYEAVTDADARMSGILEKAEFPLSDQHQQPQKFSNEDDGLAQASGDEVVRRNHWRWGGIAASIIVAGLVALQMLPNQGAPYSIETSAGETRTVTLDDGSKILLNGNTRIVLDHNDPRVAEIARGEARFAVMHDDSDPFTVIAGERRLVDIGTIFNVVRTDQQLRVGVVEGAVRFEGASRTVDLRRGDSLVEDIGGSVEVSQSPAATIGSWAEGVLVYDQAPLTQVADDLSRSMGIVLEFPPEMRSGRFSGVIQTDGDQDAVRGRLEELTGARIVADGTRWSVEAR